MTLSIASQNLCFDGDFLQATKCAFLQLQQKFCGWQLSAEVPSSVATFRGTIEQPTNAHTAFLRGLVGRILVRQPPDLPDLLLRPCSKRVHVSTKEWQTETSLQRRKQGEGQGEGSDITANECLSARKFVSWNPCWDGSEANERQTGSWGHLSHKYKLPFVNYTIVADKSCCLLKLIPWL